jgi:murein DD-endopeptidase MepM/ murein hydrolase activator NlpD
MYPQKGWNGCYFFPVERPVSFENSWRDTPKPHQGIDIYPLKRSDIYAITGGVIEMIPNIWLILRGKDKCGYFYCHLQGFSSDIKRGTQVKKGQVLGYIGTTGISSKYGAPHLHFETFPDYRVRKRENPYQFLVQLSGGKGSEPYVKVSGESTRFLSKQK